MSICEYCGKKIKDGNRFCHGHNNSKNNQGFKKGNIPWNKGKSGIYNEESLEKMRKNHEGQIPWNKGIPCDEKTKEKISKNKTGKCCGEDNPFYGKKHTDVAKQKNREAHLGNVHDDNYKDLMSKRMTGQNNPSYGIPRNWNSKSIYYDSPLQGKIYLRSSYELAYAKYLDEHKILWMYEIETFDLGDNTYTPDFFLPQFEKFVEIKGYMSKIAQEKINKFLEQYPWDLEVLKKDDLIKLGCDIK